MSVLKLNYGHIGKAYLAINQAAINCEERVKRMKEDLIPRFDEFEMGPNGNTSSAESYLHNKIAELNRKHGAYSNYANSLFDFLNGSDGAKEVDEKVASSIKVEALKQCEIAGIDTGFFARISAGASELLCRSGVGRWLYDVGTSINGWLDRVKFWYQCEGGKYVVRAIYATVVLIGAAVVCPAAIAPFGVALAGGGFFTTVVVGASLGSAAFTVCNSITDVVNEAKAAAVYGTDPAWAQRYGEIDTMASYLRETRFSSAGMNKFSYEAANFLQVTETVCAIVGAADTAVNFSRFIAKGGATAFKNAGGGIKGAAAWLKNANHNIGSNFKKNLKTAFDQVGKERGSRTKAGAAFKGVREAMSAMKKNPDIEDIKWLFESGNVKYVTDSKLLPKLYNFGTGYMPNTSFSRAILAVKHFTEIEGFGGAKFDIPKIIQKGLTIDLSEGIAGIEGFAKQIKSSIVPKGPISSILGVYDDIQELAPELNDDWKLDKREGWLSWIG